MKNLFSLLIVLFSCYSGSLIAGTSDSASAIRDKVATDLVSNLAKKSYTDATKDFAVIMKNALSPKKLKVDWEKLLVTYGDFQSIMATSSETKNEYVVVKKRCKFAKDNANVLVTFNDDNKVVGLYFKP